MYYIEQIEHPEYREQCTHCDSFQEPFYYYGKVNRLGTEILCEDCLPRCQNDDCEELALSEEHDFCESCNEKIVAEEEGAS